jgi:peptide/nickel transport system substrate-binding protein
MDEQLKDLGTALDGGRISRREFIQICLGLGVSMSAATLLAGCGPGETPTSAPTAGAPATSVPVVEASPTAAGPLRGGTLRIGKAHDPDTLDPHKSGLIATGEVTCNVFDGLFFVNESLTPLARLADTWDFSADGKIITVRLRQGLKFHDGTACDADAVKSDIERFMDPATAAANLWVMGPLEGVDKIDDTTVALRYTSAFPPLFSSWGGGWPISCIVSPTAVSTYGEDFGTHPVGTGPFRFVSWSPDAGIVLEKNPEYAWAHAGVSNPGVAYLDRLELKTIPEDATRVSALVSGEIDMIAGMDGVPADQAQMLSTTSGINVYSRPATTVVYIFTVTDKEPMGDVRVRKALAHAIDRQKLIDLVMGGNAIPAYSVLASSYGPYYDPSVQDISPAYDPEMARGLLAEAGYADGLTLDFLLIDSPVWRRMAEVIQEDLAQVGVTLNIDAYPLAEWAVKAPEKNHHLVFNYYSYGDPDILYGVFISSSPWALSLPQDTAAMDALLNSAHTEMDPSRRADLMHQIQQIAAQECLWLTLWEPYHLVAYRDNVEGVWVPPDGYMLFQDVSFKAG